MSDILIHDIIKLTSHKTNFYNESGRDFALLLNKCDWYNVLNALYKPSNLSTMLTHKLN